MRTSVLHTIQSRARVAVTLCAVLIPIAAGARGVSPYLPLNLSPEIEHDVERVLILADNATITRPIPAARVLDALPKACARDAALCKRVRNFLDRYMHRLAPTHASVEIAHASGHHPALPNAHGTAPDSSYVVSAGGYWQPSDYLIVNGGFVADRDMATATGSFVSVGFEYAQLDVGFRDHDWSPLTDSSMLIGTQAATMPSITLSNYSPIGSLGLSYEIFLARMSRSDHIAYSGGETSGQPRLAGLHVAIQPASGWTLAGNRLLQYGGGARGGTSLRSFFDALFKPHDYDNTSNTLNSDQQFGNQQAAWTSRIVFPGRVPFSVYFEYAGEDTSYSGNYRLGNAALSGGIDFPKLWHDFDLTYEASEWQNGWYVHGVYRDGMRNHGNVLGNWFGDERVLNDGVGGQSHMLRLGWHPKFGGVAEFRYRTLQNASYTGVDYYRLHDLTASYAYPVHGFLIGAELNGGRDVFGERYSRIAAFARYGGDFGLGGAADDSDDDASSDGASPDSVDYFADIGSSASRVRVTLADGIHDPYTTKTRYAPHFGLGARRVVGDHSDLGVRLEFDNIDSHLLIAVRALDYRYRFGTHGAFAFFAGAARYNLATPAFGYYGGIGGQWRNLTRHLDLNLDVRYGDKIARDKLLSSDPPSTQRPDEFFDLIGATLYLSYRL